MEASNHSLVSEIYAIIGLGNPGEQYRDTRHNLGFRFVDAVASKHTAVLRLNTRLKSNLGRIRIAGAVVYLAQPMTYMNCSGIAFNLVANYYNIKKQNIFVAYDDLDLPVGSVRLRHGGGHGGHNGVRNIMAESGSSEFPRVRFGIGRPPPPMQVTPFVLSVASAFDRNLNDIAIADTVRALPELIAGNREKAMTALHSRSQVVAG